jgi:hypothetical protein
MNAQILLSPFFVIALSRTEKGYECLNHLSKAIHITTPKQGSPSPFDHGIMTFYSVTDRNPIRTFTKGKTGIYC